MASTLNALFLSAKRLRRKQNIWSTDIGFDSNEVKGALESVVPFRGTKMIIFRFKVPGLTEYYINPRTKAKSTNPIPHHEIFAFLDCDIEIEPPEDMSNYFVVNYRGTDYYVKKIDVKKQRCLVRCDCFTGDTEVMLADGTSATMESLVGKENFEVISYNEDSNKFEIATCKKCEKKSEDSEIIKITLDNGKEIKTTLNHVFKTKNDGWVQAKDLQVGQSLKALYGFSDGEKLYQVNDNKNSDNERQWHRIRRYSNNDDYYVYIYLDPRKPGDYNYDGISFGYEPIYVGKGKKNRCQQHLSNRLTEDSYFYRKLNKIISEGYEPIIVKQSTGLTENLALEFEKNLIKKIGVHFDKTGPLTNNTYGGEGSSGLIQSEKVKNRMRNNNPMSNPDVVKQQVETSRERGWYATISENMENNNPMKNKEVVEKMTNTHRELGHYSSDNMKKMASARTDDTFKKIVETRKKNNPNCYDKLIEGAEKYRKEAIANGTHYLQSEKHKKLTSEQSKSRWQDPSIRQKMIDGFKERHKDPTYQESIHKGKILKGMVEVIKKYGEFLPEHYESNGKRMKLETVKARGWYDEMVEKAMNEAFYNHKIVKIERVENAPTYCLTVDGLGNFVVATPDNESNLFSGIVVKNCSDFIFTWAYHDFKTGNLYGPPPKPYIRKTPLPPLGRPRRNACFVGSTKLKLLDGTVKTFEELYNSQDRFWVYSCDETGKFHPGNSSTVFKTGEVTHLVKVTLDNGLEEICTPEHLWMLRDGTYREAQYLESGQSLMPLYTTYGEEKKPFYGYERILENNTNKWLFTHRLVMQDIADLNYFDYSKVIHHYDINKTNNNPDNLIPMTKKEHKDLHRLLSEKSWTPEKREMHRLITKKLWENEEYRIFMSDMMKKLWNNKEHRIKISKSSKKAWLNPEYRETVTKAIKKHHSNPEYRESVKKRFKQLWNDTEFRIKMSEAAKLAWTNERRKQISEISKNNMMLGKIPSIVDFYGGYDSFVQCMQERAKNEDFITNLKSSLKKVWANPNSKMRKEASERNSNNVKMKWSNDENKIKHQKTIIERIVKEVIKCGYEPTEENWDVIIRDYAKKTGKSMRDLRTKKTVLKYYNNFNDLLESIKVNHKVVKIEHIYLDKPEPVYDITVEKYHNFALASGVYVHNSGYPGMCKHIYFLWVNFFQRQGRIEGFVE